jgi:hypothetical protein
VIGGVLHIGGSCGLEALSSVLSSPDHPGQEPEPKSEGERGQRALLNCILKRVAERRSLRFRPVGDDPRADRRRHSPLIPYWRGHVSSRVAPVAAGPRRYRLPRPKSGQKDRLSCLSCSPSPSPSGQTRRPRLRLAFRCFVQRQTESPMSCVSPKHVSDVNVGPQGRFPLPGRSHRSSSTYRRCFRMSATIKIGDDRNAPIGPQSQVQNASESRTASALSSRWRPMIIGVRN